jgi:hypothetical protein
MPRPLLALLFLATGLLARAQAPQVPSAPLAPHPVLMGRIDGDTYYSANGAFKVPIPVRAEMGGDVTDNANVVTMRDDYTLLYIIAAFPMDSSQKWELSIHTRQEYLQGFFTQYVLPDFRRAFNGVEVEKNGTYMPTLFDGALVVYTLLPGGSMFTSKLVVIDPTRKPPVAKRGNMIFVNNGYVFVISTELAERVTEGSAYSLTEAQEDVALREKLVDMAQKIHFLTPAPSP